MLNEWKAAGVPFYYVKIHGDRRQTSTLDILGCLCGRFIGIELKAKGNEPTPRQALALRLIHQAGGVAIVAYDLDTVRERLTPILKEHYANE